MDSRLHGKYINLSYYSLPLFVKMIGGEIEEEQINIIKRKDGNGYVKIDKEENGIIYSTMERELFLPSHAITEININTEKIQLDVYTFTTVSKQGLDNLGAQYYIGYGLEGCIGIHIDIKPYYLLLTQMQIHVNQEFKDSFVKSVKERENQKSLEYDVWKRGCENLDKVRFGENGGE